VFLGVLVLPALFIPLLPRQSVSVVENRVLAPTPAWPRSAAGWRRLPRILDAYAADHFAFRTALVPLGNRVQRSLGAHTGPPRAVEGTGGWLFLSEGLLQSSGQIQDPANSADYAEFVCALHARFAALGIRSGFTIVPSPGEIYPEALPPWAGPAKRPTDYDRILAGVRACGMSAVDLRPALRAAKRDGLIYRRTDSHWTLLGAAIGYNAMLEAIGRPEWRMVIHREAWFGRSLLNGDLPAMAALEPRPEIVPAEERFERPRGPPRTPVPGVAFAARPPFMIETNRPAPTVLVIGDSFTENPMPPLFLDHVGRYAWVHHDACGFDWTVIEKVKPDLVLIAPTERETRCLGHRPLNMPLA
jgi:hypothetical protein